MRRACCFGTSAGFGVIVFFSNEGKAQLLDMRIETSVMFWNVSRIRTDCFGNEGKLNFGI